MMIPLQRVGTPEDAAGAMLMLASPYSSYITAQVLLHQRCTAVDFPSYHQATGLLPKILQTPMSSCGSPWGLLGRITYKHGVAGLCAHTCAAVVSVHMWLCQFLCMSLCHGICTHVPTNVSSDVCEALMSLCCITSHAYIQGSNQHAAECVLRTSDKHTVVLCKCHCIGVPVFWLVQMIEVTGGSMA